MKKKFLILAMFILLMLAMIPSAMAACSHTCTWRITKSATCTTAGSKSYQCTKCNAVTKTATISPKGHAPTAATCTAAGKCSRCGAVTSNALGHTYSAATCTIGKKCTRCGASGGSALGHNPAWYTTKGSTCTETGTRVYKCTRCGYISKTESVAAKGHDWSSWKTTTTPTCYSAGKQERKCSRCSKTETQTLAAKPHTFKWVTTRNATCTQLGEKLYICTVCEYINGARETIPVLSHTFGSWFISKDPTCTKPGEKKRTCSQCKTSETRETPALGHDWAYTACNKPKTCTRDGCHETASLLDNDPVTHNPGYPYACNGNWVTYCVNCNRNLKVVPMKDYEFALFQNDNFAPPAQGRTGEEIEYTYRMNQFSDVIRNNYMSDATNTDIAFLAYIVKEDKSEADMEKLLSVVSVRNSALNPDQKKQAIIELGYDPSTADFYINPPSYVLDDDFYENIQWDIPNYKDP